MKRYTNQKHWLTACKDCPKAQNSYGTCTDNEFQDCNHIYEAIDRLAELENKIENGTLIELPCKVGDTVYWVFELVKNKLEILEGKIRGLSISQNNTSWFSVIYEYGLTFEHTFKDYWNKTVFLTKAEAEQRLKELKDESTKL